MEVNKSQLNTAVTIVLFVLFSLALPSILDLVEIGFLFVTVNSS